jgi:GNAT superfamily N-acetyltransferase
LRDSVFAPPLERKLSWPWVPHVTLADGIDPDRIDAAEKALDAYTAVAVFDRVVLLEERRGRVWAPVADAALERRTVVGTGGLPLLISRGRLVDPLAAAMIEEEGQPLGSWPAEGFPAREGAFYPVVMTGRREEGTVGVAIANGPDRVSVFVRPDARRQGIGALLVRHLLAATGTPLPRTAPASSGGGGR